LDITTYGGTCFRIAERGHTTILTDPLQAHKRSADSLPQAELITCSQPQDAQRLRATASDAYIIASPGEYEIGDLFVTGIALHIAAEASGAIQHNIAYYFEYPNRLSALHLGTLHAMPAQTILEELPEVHALLLPVGGAGIGTDELAEITTTIEPKFAVPMQPPGMRAEAYASVLSSYLQAMGISDDGDTRETLRVSASNLGEQTQILRLQALP